MLLSICDIHLCDVMTLT